MFRKLKARGFDVEALHHAEAILRHDMASAVSELEAVLLDFTIPMKELVSGGGGEGKGTQRLRNALASQGWLKHTFEVSKSVDGKVRESASHVVDHVKSFGEHSIALEIEWNNKDPFFNRDLENFKRFHAGKWEWRRCTSGVPRSRGDVLQQ